MIHSITFSSTVLELQIWSILCSLDREKAILLVL